MTIERRRLSGMRTIAGLIHGLTLVPGWSRQPSSSAAARAYERTFMRRLARQLVKPVTMDGAQPGGAGTLFVANHISWLDIVILGGLLDANFIAKDDVSAWPLIGPLAKKTATVFVMRDRRHEVQIQADAIAERLRSGGSLILFAEGTTSDGRTILPFRSSLFAAAEAAARIQPLTISYSKPDGSLLSPEETDIVGWIGDDTLLGNAAQVSRLKLAAHVELMEAFTPDPQAKRREISERCRDAIVAAYERRKQQAAARRPLTKLNFREEEVVAHLLQAAAPLVHDDDHASGKPPCALPG